MKLFELTTGVIAAVILALGVGHYMNNNKVEEEPVMEETKATVDVWFKITIINPAALHEDPENQQIDGYYDFETEAPCDEESGYICALKLRTGEDPEDFVNMSVDEVINIEQIATYTLPGNLPEYSYFDEQP